MIVPPLAHLSRPLRRQAPLLALFAALALAGCDDSDSTPASASGGGSSSTGGLLGGGEIIDGAGSGGGGGSGPVSVGGSVVKGIVRNALISVYAPQDDGGYELIASTVTGADGGYGLLLPDGFSGAFKLVASDSGDPEAPTEMRCDAPAGCGEHVEGAAGDDNDDGLVDYGEWYAVSGDFSLRAVGWADAGGVRVVNLTPLSTLAADWAEQFPQGLDPDSVDAANEQVAAMFGFTLADMELPGGDLTDPMWLNLADPEQIQLALLFATFQQIAAMYEVDSQFIIDLVAGAFVERQGRLPELSDDPNEANLGLFYNVALGIAGVVEWPDDGGQTHDDVTAAMQSFSDTLESGVMAGAPKLTVGRLLRPLGQLGEDLGYILEVTGLEDPQEFIEAQWPYFDWLASTDTTDLVPLAFETVVYSVLGSMMLDEDIGASEVDILNLGSYRVTLNADRRDLTVVGLRGHQYVNLVVDLTPFIGGAEDGEYAFGIEGSVLNSTGTGSIVGTLGIDLHNTNLVPLLNAMLGNVAEGEDAATIFNEQMQLLAYSAEVTVTLDGEASYIRNSDNAQVLSGAVSLEGHLNLGAALGETIATLDVHSADLRLPNGDHYYGLDGVPVLTVVVGDDATLVLDGAADVLGLPTAYAHAEGTLGNSRALVEHIRQVVLANVTATFVDDFINDPVGYLGSMLGDMLDFDITQMTLQGEGSITIPDLNHEYRASVDNLQVTVYQPHSDRVAATAELDLDEQAVHMMLGREPWDLRVLMTPTPRLVLLGPDGASGQLTQEEAIEFMAALPMAGVLPVWPEGIDP